MYDVDWTKIKNGAETFEELAREYVKDIFSFPYGKWEKTSTTHDGNKDAYTIIIGFHPELLENEVWWMEAKYSTERIYLSRFKLDATIVSSIFNQSISKIIFVTNIDIKAKVISDVRTALYSATSCKEVYFCTKKTLEFWLYQNPSIYQKYFIGILPIPSGIKDLFVSEDIKVYSVLNTMRDVSSLKSITTNRLYEAHFKVVSNCQQQIKITSAQKGIKRLSSLYVDIQQGENPVVVQFKIEDKFFNYAKHSTDGIIENNLCFFKLNNNVPILTQYPLSISTNENTQLIIESQENFERNFQKYKFKQQASYWLVDGTTGCGKTTLIQKCAEEKAIKKINYRFIDFSKNVTQNVSELISVVFFIFFPYMYSEDITVDYLETLEINLEFKEVLCELKKINLNEYSLQRVIKVFEDFKNILFSCDLQINPQIIVLDNVQLLSENNIKILFSLLEGTQKLPIMYILSCNSYFMENSAFRQRKNQLVFKCYHMELTVNDIIQNMEKIFLFSFDISNGIIEYVFPNIIVFKIYVNYVMELGNDIANLDDFILSYITFKRNYVSDEYINRQFSDISEKDIRIWETCQEIYNYETGIKIAEGNKEQIEFLLRYGLIKYNEVNNLVPINDIYLIHYRRRYLCISDSTNPVEHLVWQLSTTLLSNELENYYAQIHKMRENEEFQTVNYILESCFENNSLDTYKKIWGDEIFYLLYFEYTYAAINCNNTITGYDNLQYIYTHIKGTSSIRLGKLLLEIIFELINCDYNNGRYSACRDYYEIFNTQFSILAKKGEINKDCKKNLFWVLGTGYMIFIDSVEGNINALDDAQKHKDFLLDSYPFHYVNFCRQFSKTLYTRDWKLACEWQMLAYNAVKERENQESKQVLTVNFDFYFTQYLKTQDPDYLKEMKKTLSISKSKIYSSYRHQLFLYCGLLYTLDSIDEADALFVKDIITLRPIRQKMKGHYYMLMSLHFLKHDNILDAQKYTGKTLETLKGLKEFEKLTSHNDLVLKNTSIAKMKFQFCTSDVLNEDTFYIDSRM